MSTMEPDNLAVFGGDSPELELLKLHEFARALGLMERAVFGPREQTFHRPEGQSRKENGDEEF